MVEVQLGTVGVSDNDTGRRDETSISSLPMDRASSCSSTGQQLNLSAVRPEKSSAQRASASFLKHIAGLFFFFLKFKKTAASEVPVWS